MTDIAVRLTDVEKHYGSFQAVTDMTLDIPEGSFVTLLGPSGCGKTTTLRMIAGLESISAGEIAIKGRRVNEIPIHKRNLGVVFQNYALFPHMTVADNVAFGLKYRKVAKADAREKVRRALQIVRLPHLEDRMPSQLSGGQQQRIALARAIVVEPDVLLLDEPLSALDRRHRDRADPDLRHAAQFHQPGNQRARHHDDRADGVATADRRLPRPPLRQGRPRLSPTQDNKKPNEPNQVQRGFHPWTTASVTNGSSSATATAMSRAAASSACSAWPASPPAWSAAA